MAIPVLAANCTWFTQGGTSVKRASITTIEIKNSYTPTGTVTSSWDASAAKDGGIVCYVEGTKLTIAGNGSGSIYLNTDSSNLFSDSKNSDYFKNVTAINGTELFATTGSTTMMRAFNRCEKLLVAPAIPDKLSDVRALFQYCYAMTTADASGWDLSRATSLQNVFFDCWSLTTVGNLSGWNTSNVTSFASAFQNCFALQSVDMSGWDTAKVTTTFSMFYGNPSLGSMKITSVGNLSGWNVSGVTTAKNMFYRCSLLKEVNTTGWVLSSLQDASFMFSGCSSLKTLGNTSTWGLGNCTTTESMFAGCENLSSLDVSNWDTSKVITMQRMFFCGTDFGTNTMSYTVLDVSNWDTSSCTDMGGMFYGCDSPKAIDVSGWDVSKVTTFDHMFAHSCMTIGDVSGWTTPAATNMNAMFYSVQNEVLDVSNLVTENVTVFTQMFESCGAKKIIGLDKFNTSKGVGFDQMFLNCANLEELDLSSFDTTKAKDGATASTNGSTTATMANMLSGLNRLKKIIFGGNFSFNGDGTTTSNVAVLTTPSATYITGADGKWYDIDKNAYAPSAIPSRTTRTYYASTALVDADDNRYVLVKNGTLMRTAAAIRIAKGTQAMLTPSEFASAITG